MSDGVVLRCAPSNINASTIGDHGFLVVQPSSSQLFTFVVLLHNRTLRNKEHMVCFYTSSLQGTFLELWLTSWQILNVQIT